MLWQDGEKRRKQKKDVRAVVDSAKESMSGSAGRPKSKIYQIKIYYIKHKNGTFTLREVAIHIKIFSTIQTYSLLWHNAMWFMGTELQEIRIDALEAKASIMEANFFREKQLTVNSKISPWRRQCTYFPIAALHNKIQLTAQLEEKFYSPKRENEIQAMKQIRQAPLDNDALLAPKSVSQARVIPQ